MGSWTLKQLQLQGHKYKLIAKTRRKLHPSTEKDIWQAWSLYGVGRQPLITAITNVRSQFYKSSKF